MAVEEALDELLASDTHYRRELNVQIASRIAVAEGKRRARTLELKEVSRQFLISPVQLRSGGTLAQPGMWESLKLWKDPTNFHFELLSGKIEKQFRGSGAAPDTVVPAPEGGEGTPPKCAPRNREKAGESRAVEEGEGRFGQSVVNLTIFLERSKFAKSNYLYPLCMR